MCHSFENPTKQSVYNFLTACGRTDSAEAAEHLRDNFRQVLAAALLVEWDFPNTDNTPEEIEELFFDFLGDHGIETSQINR